MTWHPEWNRTRLADGTWRVGPPMEAEAMTESEWLASDDPQRMLEFISVIEPNPNLPLTRRCISDRKLRLFAVAACRAVWDGVVCGRCGDLRRKLEQWRSDRTDGWKVEKYTKAEADWVDAIRKEIESCVCHGSGRVGGLSDPRSRRAVEVAERHADGEATLVELTPHGAYAEAAQMRRWEDVREEMNDRDDLRTHTDLQWSTLCWLGVATSKNLIDGGLNGTGLVGNGAILETAVSPATQAALLREIVGNPFVPIVELDGAGQIHHLWASPISQKAIVFDRACLAWNNRTVPKLASAIYDERRFEDMPILADALEDAGCHDVDILAHCRGLERCDTGWRHLRGPHVRGCWVLDLLLGKE